MYAVYTCMRNFSTTANPPVTMVLDLERNRRCPRTIEPGRFAVQNTWEVFF